MKAFLRSVLSLAMASGLGLAAQAQSGVPQLIIANGGVFGPANTIRMAAWEIPNSSYYLFDSLPASSVQHISIHDHMAYLCADSFLVAYNLDNHTREALVVVPGVRQTASTNRGTILVAKGYGGVGAYVEERNAADLSLVHSYTGLSGECEGIVVYNDTAFVAVPQGFGAATGRIAVLDLLQHTLKREIDLDTNGRIIKNMYLDGQMLYSVNQISYGGSYGIISAYDIATGALQHHRVDLSTSLGGDILDGKLYANFGAGIGGWSLASQSLVDTNLVPGYWAAMAVDTAFRHIFVTETDYATYGRAFEYDLFGNRIDSVAIGVSPEAIAFYPNIVTAAAPATASAGELHVYPQPFSDHAWLDLRAVGSGVCDLTVVDLAGQVVLRESQVGGTLARLDAGALHPGMYIVRVSAKGRTWTTKVVKSQN